MNLLAEVLAQLIEDNDCHVPAGSPEGGQFCATADAVTSVVGDPGSQHYSPELIEDRFKKFQAAVAERMATNLERAITPEDKAFAKRTNAAIKKDLPKSQRSIDKAEEEIRRLPKEKGIVFDLNGNVIWERQGGSKSVTWSPMHMSVMADTIMTHNHPGGMPLSFTDFEFAAHANLAEIRAIGKTPFGETTYSLKRPENGWPPDMGGEVRRFKRSAAYKEWRDYAVPVGTEYSEGVRVYMDGHIKLTLAFLKQAGIPASAYSYRVNP